MTLYLMDGDAIPLLYRHYPKHIPSPFSGAAIKDINVKKWAAEP